MGGGREQLSLILLEERASQEKDAGVRELETVKAKREFRQNGNSGETEAKERPFSNLLGLMHPTAPAHVIQFHINYDEALSQICGNSGTCHPVIIIIKE